MTIQPNQPDALIDPFNDAHSNADTDIDVDSIHHTLGVGPQQAAPGNHGGHAPIGSIIMYAGTSVPANYLVCDGSAVSRTTYKNLFTVLGTVYGAGDGSTTFNLPNLTNRVPRGNTLVASGGADTHLHSSVSAGSTDNDSHSHTASNPNTLFANATHTHPMTGIRTAGSGSLTSGGPSATVGPYTADASGATPGGGAHTHTTATHDHSIPSTDSAAGNHSHGMNGPTIDADIHSHTISGTHSHGSASNVPAYCGVAFLIRYV